MRLHDNIQGCDAPEERAFPVERPRVWSAGHPSVLKGEPAARSHMTEVKE